jgi:hypothetical protein
MMGDVASCRPSCSGYAMKIYGGLTCNLTLTKLCNYFTNILCIERDIWDMGLA